MRVARLVIRSPDYEAAGKPWLATTTFGRLPECTAGGLDRLLGRSGAGRLGALGQHRARHARSRLAAELCADPGGGVLQRVISSIVRWQPSHQPVSGLMRQTLVQGEGILMEALSVGCGPRVRARGLVACDAHYERAAAGHDRQQPGKPGGLLGASPFLAAMFAGKPASTAGSPRTGAWGGGLPTNCPPQAHATLARLASTARATREAGSRPSWALIHAAVSTSASTSTPVSIPSPSSNQTTSSVATFPDAPAA